MAGVDELHHLDLVAPQAEQTRTQRVGEDVREALTQDPLPGEQRVRLGSRPATELIRELEEEEAREREAEKTVP